MNRVLLLLYACFSVTAAMAQNQSNIWYFGEEAGLDFNVPGPQPLLDNELVTSQNTAVISDENGNLLFYTNGYDILDKTHNLMPNGSGMMGSGNNPQGIIIIPKPLSLGIYYVFAADEDFNGGALRYSVVDMSLNGGLGDVTDEKNVLLVPQSSRRITAVKHDNDEDVWIITHDINNNAFISILVTSQGITSDPVVSTTGSVLVAGFGILEGGCIKASPNCEKLAIANLGAELCDFDDATGEVSNAVELSTLTSIYGIEFSPLSKLVYISEGYTERVFQYNTEAVDIAAFEVEITGYPDVFQYLGGGGALQLARDGKIYYAAGVEASLNVINYPDVIGTGCWFESYETGLAGRVAVFGLPVFIQSYFIPDIIAENLCFGDVTELSLVSGAPPDSVFWDFGDGVTSTELFAQHTFPAPGTYLVSLTVVRNGQSFTYTKYIDIELLPEVTPPAEVLLCNDGSVLSFDLSLLNAAILGAQPPADYEVAYYGSEATAENGVDELPSDYEMTDDYEMLYVRVTAPSGCYAIAGFVIRTTEPPTILGENNNVLCDGETMTLTAIGGYDAHVWSTGETAQSILVSSPGEYSVTGIRTLGDISCISEPVIISYSDNPEIIALDTRDMTDGQNTINVTAVGAATPEYSIDGINYQSSPLFTGLGHGLYTVYVRDASGCGSDSEEIYLLAYPNFFTPNGDGVNDLWQIKGLFFEPGTVVMVYDRFGKLLASFDGGDAGWDGKFAGQDLLATDYWFVAKRRDGRTYKGHFSLLR